MPRAPRETAGPNDPARRLSSLWREGQQPRVEDFLAQAGVSDPALVVTVLRVDQWERRRRGQWVPAESYLDAFPAVRDDPERAIDVVFAEYLLREHLGESPTFSEYARRFPQHADELKLQVELHRALEREDEGAWLATWDEGRARPPANRRTDSEAGPDSGPEEYPDIPGYEVLGVLGWGGMGVVYRAWQQRPHRMVALKMVRAGAQASPEVLARFRVEADAVARMQHPHIVQIHQVGQHAGCPFLVLELVEGPSLARSLSGTPQATRQAVELVELLARAIHSAHCQGVVHRDLTPTNILLTADGVPKITDFGLAKLVKGGEGIRTETGELLGTPSYMAPEQAASRHQAIGAATDVYALGAILYEMLTGRPPFKAESPLETIRQVVADEPVAPSRLRPKLPRDLETICLKCLRKEPAQRYAGALALADDLRRFQGGRSILARRSGALERTWRWYRRNPGLAAASTTATAAVVTLAIVSAVMALVFRDQRDQVRRAESETRENLLRARTAQAHATRLSRQVGQRFGSMEALSEAEGTARSLNLPAVRLAGLRDEAIACLALPDLKPTGRIMRRPPGNVLVAFDPAMTHYALRSRDGTIQVRLLADDREVAQFTARGDRDIFVFVFGPDGRYLATTHHPDFALTAWDIERRAVAVTDPGPVKGGMARFSPDGRRIAVGHDGGEILIYDLATGHPHRRLRIPGAEELAFGPDGSQIAVVDNESDPPACRVLEVATARHVRTISLPTACGWVAWSPDGTTLAIAAADRKIYLWDAATGTRKATLVGHTNGGLRAAFHPAGTLLASNGWEGQLRLWDPVLGRPVLSLASAFWPEFSRDGRIVVAVEDQLTEYQADPALEYRTLAHAFREPIDYARASIRRDGRVLAVGTSRGVVLWDLARGTELAYLPIGSAAHVLFEESGDLLTSGSIGMWRWPSRLDPDRREFRIGPPSRLRFFPRGDSGIAEDRSGRILALANHGVAHVLTPERAFDIGPLDDCRSVVVSPDGEWLATGSHGQGGAQVWQVRDGAPLAKLAIEGSVELLVSPDGRWLMSRAPPCRIWEPGTWRERRQIGGHGHCFSPDGRLLAVQDARRVIRLVEVETGRTLARLESPELCDVWWATFSPDGSWLVVTSDEGPAVHVWDLRAIRRRLAALRLDWDAPERSGAEEMADHPEQRAAVEGRVDFGPLKRRFELYETHLEQDTAAPEVLVARYTGRLKSDPGDSESHHQRAHALFRLGRNEEALADFYAALALRPLDAHLRAYSGGCLFNLKRHGRALDELEAAFRADPETVRAISDIDRVLNNRAWELANGGESERDPVLAARLAALALALVPGEQEKLNTLGVALYRAGRFDQSIDALEKSLEAGRGQFAAFDLFVLAMAHHRLGHRDKARAAFGRAVRWLDEANYLDARHTQELAVFRAEAEAVLGGPNGELPDDVFAHGEDRAF
jgi:WD40 repeat protein/tetratricopeptide (TPR) repeat protein